MAMLHTLAASALLALTLACAAQQPGKVYRIGFIQTAGPSEMRQLGKAFEEGMRELGWVEGRNIVIERRYAEGRQERLPALAQELVRLKVDVIVSGSNAVIDAIRQVTATIPVVMAVSRDPVGAGYVATLARPQGNITGLANDAGPELQAKNLEILKEILPAATRVAYLWNPSPAAAQAYRRAAEDAAHSLGLKLVIVPASGTQFVQAFAEMKREHVDAVMVQLDPIFFTAREQLVELAATHRLPAMYGTMEFAEAGGLIAYGPNLADQFRRAAGYVDKILRGAKPGELAVQQPAKFELMINLRTARSLGIAIPQQVLVRADRVFE